MIIYLKSPSYVEMVHTTTLAEKGIHEAAAEYASKKRTASLGTFSSSPLPKRHFASDSGSGSVGRRSAPASRVSVSMSQGSRYGKVHSGECLSMMTTCYQCGKVGHFARQYTNAAARNQRSQESNYQPRQPAQARVYSLTPDNVATGTNATDLVTGTIPLFGCVACILFDSGATHSFISSAYVKLCQLSIELLDESICVATPVGDTVTCRKCVDNWPIIIEGKEVARKTSSFQHVRL